MKTLDLHTIVNTPKEAGYKVMHRGQGEIIVRDKATGQMELWGLHKFGPQAGFNLKLAGGYYEFCRDFHPAKA
jgi:hypothetical protein